MKLIELLEIMPSGKKFRVKSWGAGEYIYFCKEAGDILDNRDNAFYISLLYPDNWELYEEPKPKVRLYKYAFKFSSTSNWEETEIFYKDDKDFINEIKHAPSPQFQKIESSMIEVEE